MIISLTYLLPAWYGFHRLSSLCFRTIYKKPIQLLIKLDVEMFYQELWKPVYFGVKRSKVKVTSHNHKYITGMIGL